MFVPSSVRVSTPLPMSPPKPVLPLPAKLMANACGPHSKTAPAASAGNRQALMSVDIGWNVFMTIDDGY